MSMGLSPPRPERRAWADLSPRASGRVVPRSCHGRGHQRQKKSHRGRVDGRRRGAVGGRVGACGCGDAGRHAATGADPVLGSRVSAVVLDAATGAVIYSRNSSLALMSASNQKLNAAFVALSTMGSSKTVHTQVKASSNRQTLWLVGGGDPGLTVNRARQMASMAQAALVRAGVKSVAVRVDDTLFPPPTNATGWKASYLPGDVVPGRALVVGGRNAMDTALDAGVIFSNELMRLGISVSATTRGKVGPGAATLVMARSYSVGSYVTELINTSNNDYAENMHRRSSLTVGKGATWTAANGHALATLKAKGVNTSGAAIHDGSGLSRSNRMSGANLASLLLAIRRSAVAHPVLYGPNAMPTAGISGTPKTRFATPDESSESRCPARESRRHRGEGNRRGSIEGLECETVCRVRGCRSRHTEGLLET